MGAVRSRGVTIFGYILVVCSLYQILLLATAGYGQYAYLHQEYSPNVIVLRYLVSWVIKIMGLIAGIGLLKLCDWARWLAIFNSIFIICTIHLKHSYAAYILHLKNLDEVTRQTIGGLPNGITFTSLVGPALMIQRLIDIIFGVALIYFLTRPEVKKQFHP